MQVTPVNTLLESCFTFIIPVMDHDTHKWITYAAICSSFFSVLACIIIFPSVHLDVTQLQDEFEADMVDFKVQICLLPFDSM